MTGLNRQRRWQDEDLSFLPPALALIYQSPPRGTQGLLLTLVGIIAIATIGVVYGKLDIVGVAEGRIIAEGKARPVQSPFGATVAEVLVAEGDRVLPGEPLIILDDFALLQELARLTSEYHNARLRAAQLAVLLEAIPEAIDPTEGAVPCGSIADGAMTGDIQLRLVAAERQFSSAVSALRAGATLVARHQQQLRTTLLDFLQQRNLALRQLGLAADQCREHAAERARTHAAAGIIGQRTEQLRLLLERSLVARAQWLEFEQQRVDAQQRLKVMDETTAVLHTQWRLAHDASSSYVTEARSAWQTEFQALTITTETLRSAIARAQHQHEQARILAPVAGAIQEVAVRGSGDGVAAGAVLMVVAPVDAALEVEALIRNADIGFVHTGQRARIKINTFPFTMHGTVGATVSSISADAVSGDDGAARYLARLRLDTQSVVGPAGVHRLGSGMNVSVEFALGERTILEFLLGPILRYRDESARER